MKNVFRPPIYGPRDSAEEVLHACSHAGPMMGLQLRHRHDEVRPKEFDRKGELLETHVAALQCDILHVVLVQIDETDAMLSKVLVQSGPCDEVVGVAAMSWSFSDSHLG